MKKKNLVYITPVGSGKTLSHPIENKYDGIIAIAENSENFGLNYKNSHKKEKVSQDELFKSVYSSINYKINELIITKTNDSLFNTGSKILDVIYNILKDNPKTKFHIELSPGYKELPHILQLISQFISENVEKITFTKFNKIEQKFPINKIKITKEKIEVLKEFEKGRFSEKWNGKVISNPYLHSKDSKHLKYVYRILKESVRNGYLNDNYALSDFGKLVINYYK